uniref:Sushi domain-containing protein n=1 Tax=Caenorhabditis tropicalis TaxID=1561998 RepID=A0A1I7TUP9_9PELO
METVSATLTCEMNGMYSSGTANGITTLTCEYTNCVTAAPCTACDINAIAPTGLPAGTNFEITDTTPAGGCTQTLVTCMRTDDQVCTGVSITATNADGQTVISSDTGTAITQSSTQLTCQLDGTYSGGTTTGITALSCEFTGCATPIPCTACDINAISPTGLPTGQMFSSVDTTPAGGCTTTEVSCRRTDDQYCTGVSITATTPTGDSTISSSTGTSVLSSSATLTCQIGGTYSSGTAMQISQLSCVFTGCYPPSCSSCDGNRIAPTSLPPGTEFTFREDIFGGCKYIEVTCARTDGLICESITIQGTIEGDPGGPYDIASNLNVGTHSTSFYCGDDGNYAVGL